MKNTTTPSPIENTEQPAAKEACTFAMLCHLGALAGYLIPFGNIVGPLVFWLSKKDQYAFVDDQGKESLNFQITVSIVAIISAILTIVVIGFILLLIVAIGSLVLVIMATVAASSGKAYRYPVCLRLIK
jgi:uncharacterized Tic20 family protein